MPSVVRKTIRDAIITKIATALPKATIIVQPDITEIGNQHPGGLLVDVVGPTVEYTSSEELSVVIQSEKWTWEIGFLVPGTGKVCDEVADDVFEDLRAAFCPRAGWIPGTDCAAIEVQDEGPGAVVPGVGRVYIATYVHDRWTG